MTVPETAFFFNVEKIPIAQMAKQLKYRNRTVDGGRSKYRYLFLLDNWLGLPIVGIVGDNDCTQLIIFDLIL